MFVHILIVFIAILLFIFDRKQFKYWKELQIPHLNPSFLIGNIKDLVLQRTQISIFFEEVYRTNKEYSITGIYFSYRPVILVNDIELAKNILTKDFHCFHDRGFFIDPKIDPLTENLFCLPGTKWKQARQKLTPLFSASKLKNMLPIIQENFHLFENTVDNQISSPIDIRDYASKLTLTLISSIAFGLYNDCFNDPDNIFRQKTLKVLEPSFIPNARFMTALFLPKICKMFKIGFFSKEVNDFYIEITKKIVEYREQKNSEFNDFLKLFMQLRNTDSFKENEKRSSSDNFTLNDIAAHSFIFVLAGYETTAGTISFCLFELAKNQEIMRKVQEEIDEFSSEELSYEIIKKLKYLDKCINETLRKYPVLPFLNRLCKWDYQISGTNYIIPKDTPVIIPTYAIQRDPQLYSNPTEFIPERFNENNSEVPLLSFGYGNRTCIGKRMAQIVAKCYIFDILSKFNIKLSSSEKEIEFSHKTPSLTPLYPIMMKFSRR